MQDLEGIYRQHAPAVFRYAWGLSGDRTEAEDLVSETFVRLLTRAPKLETQTALAYLLAITFGLGPLGVFASVAICESVLAMLSAVVFQRGRWKQVKV